MSLDMAEHLIRLKEMRRKLEAVMDALDTCYG